MISKDTFVKIMNALRDSNNYADRMDELINPIIEDRTTVYGKICFSELLCDWKLQDVILKALSKELDDEEDYYGETWIDYFVYELDWGKKWEYGRIRDAKGNDIKMQTAEDLYDYLAKNSMDAQIERLCDKCK